MDPVYTKAIKHVLAQVHPDMRISKESTRLIKILLSDLLKKIIERLDSKHQNIPEMNEIIIDIMQGELAKHACSEGGKFPMYIGKYPFTEELITYLITLENILDDPPQTFVIQYICSVIEYISAELLELSGNCARDKHRVIIKPLHIKKAIQDDEELEKMYMHLINELHIL